MQSLLTRVAIAAGLGIVALVVAILGLAFFGGALFFWLREQSLSPAAAALCVGAAGFVLALLLLLIAKLMFSGGRARTRNVTTTTDAAGVLGQTIMRETLSLAQAHPYRTLLVSVMAGFLAGAIPELRRLPFSFFKK
jgi:hypothetical protein